MDKQRNSPVIAHLHDDRNRMDYWFPPLEELEVPTPLTKFFEITVDNGVTKVNSDNIVAYMNANDWNKAFIRSMYKSAELRPFKGSYIKEPTKEEVEKTIESLLDQHNAMGMPHGNKIAVREWMDLDYCLYRNHNHESEVRFFIENGEISYHFPSIDHIRQTNLSSKCIYTHVREMLDHGIELPDDFAQLVAEEFTNFSWHVDFALTSFGNWYCIDMGLNGLYWNEDREKWMNIASHKNNSDYNLAEKYADELPSGHNLSNYEEAANYL